MKQRDLKIILFLIVIACACAGRENSSIRSISHHSGNALTPAGWGSSHKAREGHTLHTIKVGLPKGSAKLAESWQRVTAFDDAGDRYESIGSSLTKIDGIPTALAATFELPNGRSPQRLLVGQYEIDLRNSQIRQRP